MMEIYIFTTVLAVFRVVFEVEVLFFVIWT